MNHIKALLIVATLLPALAPAEEQHHPREAQSTHGVQALSPEIRELLSREMKEIQNGMMSIIPAYTAGHWDEIETTASQIKNSYLLKQNLTEAQKEELHAVLPSEFIEQDQRFHYLAGMLAHAAKNRKPELINFYFSEMNESCVACHTAYAGHKFPRLVSSQKEAHSH